MLVTSARAGNFDVYVMEADGSGVRLVTGDARSDQHADWAPDGFRFAFMSNRDGDFEVFTMLANGRDLRQLTSNTASDGFPRRPSSEQSLT